MVVGGLLFRLSILTFVRFYSDVIYTRLRKNVIRTVQSRY